VTKLLPAKNDLRGAVVVITGASSGIGRATAVALAERGCRLTLVARRQEGLEETARLCRDAGGEAICLAADVTDETDVDRVVLATLATWDKIDVFINNAGVTLFAKMEDAPFEDHRRVIETNLFGAMLGARAAVPVFRRQGRGILVNVSSVLGEVGHAFVPSYTVSKFAMRGLSEALRNELADEPDIHVVTVYPYAVDTQHFETAANVVGKGARAMPYVQPPERVAEAIVDGIRHPRRSIHVPRAIALGVLLHQIFPSMTERLLLHALERFHFEPLSEPPTEGNLFEPVATVPPRVHGSRLPRISTPRFVVWAAVDLVRSQLADLGLSRRPRHREP
jgi:short-subunit dehydrogenase